MNCELQTQLFEEQMTVGPICDENDEFLKQLKEMDLEGVQKVMQEMSAQQNGATRRTDALLNIESVEHQSAEVSWRGYTNVYRYEGPRCASSNLPKTQKRSAARGSHTFDPRGPNSKSKKDGFIMLSRHAAPPGKLTAGGYDAAIRFVPRETHVELLNSVCPIYDDQLVMDCEPRKGNCFVCDNYKEARDVWAGIFDYKEGTVEATEYKPAMTTKYCSVPWVCCTNPECISYIIKRIAELPVDTEGAISTSKTMARRVRIVEEQNSMMLSQIEKQTNKIKELRDRLKSQRGEVPVQILESEPELASATIATSENVMTSMQDLRQRLDDMNMNMLEEDRQMTISNAKESIANVMASLHCNQIDQDEKQKLREENAHLKKRVLDLEATSNPQHDSDNISTAKKFKRDTDAICNLLCYEDMILI